MGWLLGVVLMVYGLFFVVVFVAFSNFKDNDATLSRRLQHLEQGYDPDDSDTVEDIEKQLRALKGRVTKLEKRAKADTTITSTSRGIVLDE